MGRELGKWPQRVAHLWSALGSPFVWVWDRLTLKPPPRAVGRALIESMREASEAHALAAWRLMGEAARIEADLKPGQPGRIRLEEWILSGRYGDAITNYEKPPDTGGRESLT